MAEVATTFQVSVPELDRIDANVQQILAILTPSRPATKVTICLTSFTPKAGGPVLPGTITMTDDHIAHTPVAWTDDVGPVTAPTDAVVTSSNSAVITVAFNANMTDVDTTPVADGTASWTVSSASRGIANTVSVTVSVPVATGVSASASGTTFTPKPAPTPAPPAA